MSIVEFSFTDHSSGWTVKPFTLKPSLNLLVGISGAGKSQTLGNLFTVCKAALAAEYVPGDCEWSLKITSPEGEYLWRARTRAKDDDAGVDEVGGAPNGYDDYEFSTESISVNGEMLFERTPTETTFGGVALPSLSRDESGVRLFLSDKRIRPLAQALARVRLSYDKPLRRVILDDGLAWSKIRHKSSKSLSDLARDVALMFPLKAYVLQEKFKADFERLVLSPYREIFPTVTDVRVDLAAKLFPEEAHRRPRKGRRIDVAIRERGVKRWIGSEGISQGMERTLVHLLELALSPPGTVLLIDEYESGMGVNCLPAVTRHLRERAGELQFIITSHHPYVIGNIDKEDWLVVQRHGSEVSISPASSSPSLNTSSRQDAFIQLLNSDAYMEGIS